MMLLRSHDMVIAIDRERPSARVSWLPWDVYDDEGEPWRSTPFRTADLPVDDNAAAAKVAAWIFLQRARDER